MADRNDSTKGNQPASHPPNQPNPTQPGYRPEPKTPAVEKAKQGVRDANK